MEVKRYHYIFGIILILIGYCILFGIQTVLVLPIWFRTNGEPGFEAVPKKLNIEAGIISTDTTALSCYGYSFKVPWEVIEREDIIENGTLITFMGGNSICINNSKSLSKPNRFLSGSLESWLPFYRTKLIEILDSNTLESEYLFMKACLEATPNELTIFTTKDKALRDCFFLEVKLSHTLLSETGIYSFELPAYKGFQLGTPDKSSRVSLHLFDEHDRILEILVLGSNGLSQDEINCVLTTINKEEKTTANNRLH